LRRRFGKNDSTLLFLPSLMATVALLLTTGARLCFIIEETAPTSAAFN
jgi:hypothetical protein